MPLLWDNLRCNCLKSIYLIDYEYVVMMMILFDYPFIAGWALISAHGTLSIRLAGKRFIILQLSQLFRIQKIYLKPTAVSLYNISLNNLSLNNISLKTYPWNSGPEPTVRNTENKFKTNISVPLHYSISPNNISLNNLSLNNISLNNISLNNIAPNNISLNNISLNNISLNNISLNNISLNNISLNIEQYVPKQYIPEQYISEQYIPEQYILEQYIPK